MSDKDDNGICPLGVDWRQFRNEMNLAVRRIDLAHESILDVYEDTKHLKSVADDLKEMKNNFVNALLGKDIVSIQVHTELLKGQRDAYKSIIRIQNVVYGLIIIVLLGLQTLAPRILAWLGA